MPFCQKSQTDLIHPTGNRIYSIEAVELEGAPPAGQLINGGSGEPRTIPITGGAMENNAPVGLLQGQSAAGTEAGAAARLPTDTSPMQGFSLAPSTPERDARHLRPLEIRTDALSGNRSDWRKITRDYIATHLQGRSFTNRDTGWGVGFNSESKAESISKIRKESAYRTALNLETLVEEAILLGDTSPQKGRETDSERFHYFAMPVIVDGKEAVAWFNVRKHVRGGARSFYEFGLYEKSAAQTSPGLGIENQSSQSNTPTSGPPLTLLDFMQAVKNDLPAAIKAEADTIATDPFASRPVGSSTSPMQGFSLERGAGGSQPLWQGISGHAKDGQAKTIAILGRTEQGTYRMRIPGGREQEMSEATVASMTGFSAEQLRGLPDSAAAFSETPSVTRKAEQAAQAKAAQPAVDAQREAFTRRLGQPYGRLTEEQGKMEAAFIEMISSDVAGAVTNYVKRFGNRVDADNARRLYPSFDSSRESRQALTPVTARPANALAQEVYKSMLEDPALLKGTGADPNGPVLFLAGGAGSGKSSSIDPSDAQRYSIIVDSVLGNKKRAISQIDMAVAKGRKVHIQYVHQPLDKAVDNAIQRALDPKDGRIVPAHAVANTHLNAQKTLLELREHYANNPDVTIKVVDHDNFAARSISIGEMAGRRYTQSAEELAQQARDHAQKALQRRAGQEGLTPEMVEQILAAP